MIIFGIDIGLTGALAWIASDGQMGVEDLATTEVRGENLIDCRALATRVREIAPADVACLAVIEDVRPRPMGNADKHGNTMHSQGSLMRSRGHVEAVLAIRGIRLEVVQPQSWKREFGLLRKKDAPAVDKDAACLKALDLWPHLQGDLARKRDHNRADALLIARFGQMRFA